jgi:fumarylacetoacetase
MTGDETHDPRRRSWVESAQGSAFPIQNLPYGVFRRRGRDEPPRIGVAIGDCVLDVRGCVEARLLRGLTPDASCALCATTLNDFLALGPAAWRAARRAIGDLLDERATVLRDDAPRREALLPSMASADMLLPAAIGDYTDFYCSIHHATNVGSMFRPEQPLFPNYRHLPVGYHGRTSSIVVSGTPVRRPRGQTKADAAELPAYQPSRLLDYEMEVGFLVGPGNELGHPLEMSNASGQIFGLCIVNDWSARDVQKWEYQPLGPFTAKNFATTISPWVVTLDALAPFRGPGPDRAAGDPPVLAHLRPAEPFAIDVAVEVRLASAAMRERGIPPVRVSRGSMRDLYWTIAQMLVHHTSTGCNLRPGDLIATGTISGATEESRGCLLERTWRGERPLALPDGTSRRFLEDGDEVIMTAHAEGKNAVRIGFGECRGVVLPPV